MTALFTLDAKLEGLDAVEAALARLDPIDSQSLLEGVARMIQEQTRRRIGSEKRGPDGKAWLPNRAGTSTLYRSGALSRSIDYSVAGEAAIIGSGLVYAGIHQTGGTIRPKKARRLVFRLGNKTVFARKVTIPARPYLGISPENGEDILDAVATFLRRILGGGR